MNVQMAQRFEDLLDNPSESSPYEYSMMFARDGWLARKRSAKRFKLLKGIDPKLQRILRAGERVYFVTTGTTATLSEQFFVGWAALYINRRALVFTTERIILLQIDRRGRPRELVSQMPVAALASVRATWTGTCRVKLLNREVHNFQHVPRTDRKFVAKLLGDIAQGTTAPFSRGQGVEHLCPHCFTSVPGWPDSCPTCSGEFKSERAAMLRSLAFPGLGDWYLGHRAFAGFEMLGSAFLWLVLVVAPLLASFDPEAEPLDPTYWVTAAVIIGIGHAVDAVMTRHFARKGHHPGKPPSEARRFHEPPKITAASV